MFMVPLLVCWSGKKTYSILMGVDRREDRKMQENATAVYTVPLSQFKPPFSSISLCKNNLENITVAIHREGEVNLQIEVQGYRRSYLSIIWIYVSELLNIFIAAGLIINLPFGSCRLFAWD